MVIEQLSIDFELFNNKWTHKNDGFALLMVCVKWCYNDSVVDAVYCV